MADELVFGQHPMKENYHDSYASVQVSTCLPDQAKEVKNTSQMVKTAFEFTRQRTGIYIFVERAEAWKFETIDQFLVDMKGERNHG